MTLTRVLDPTPLVSVIEKVGESDLEIARRLGVHATTIRRWRTGQHRVDLFDADRYAIRLGWHPVELWPAVFGPDAVDPPPPVKPPRVLPTHCGNGHLYTPETTRLRSDGQGRKCLLCKRDNARAHYARHHGRPEVLDDVAC